VADLRSTVKAALAEHPLGFRKIRLLRVAGCTVRLHVWHGGVNEDPHSHRWSFLSLPLLGRFVDTRWTVVAGDGWTVYDCEPPSGGARPPLREVGPSRLVELRRVVRRPLWPYVCRRGEIHSYRPEGAGRHVSLVFLGRPRRSVSQVWRRVDD